ncbi:hypothetical protein ABPG75_005783 [Micractinium tetrahymenae]
MLSRTLALRPPLSALPMLGGQPLQAAARRVMPRPSSSRRVIIASTSAGSAGGNRIAAATAALFAGGDTQAQLQRYKFLLAVNVLVPLPLGLAHLFAPAAAARVAWLGFAPPHPLLFPLLGSLWAAVGIASALALLSPDPLNAVTLIQAVYKVIFLAVAIVPAVLAGQWSAFPLIPTLVFSSFLPLLALTAPWGYLFPKA